MFDHPPALKKIEEATMDNPGLPLGMRQHT